MCALFVVTHREAGGYRDADFRPAPGSVIAGCWNESCFPETRRPVMPIRVFAQDRSDVDHNSGAAAGTLRMH